MSDALSTNHIDLRVSSVLKDATYEQLIAYLNDVLAFEESSGGQVLKILLERLVDEDVVNIRVNRDLSVEKTRLLVEGSNARLDVLTTLTQEGFGLAGDIKQMLKTLERERLAG